MAAIMRGLEGEAYDRKYSDQELVNRILHYFGPHKRKIILVTLSVLFMSLASAAVPIIISNSVGVMADGGSEALFPLLIGMRQP